MSLSSYVRSKKFIAVIVGIFGLALLVISFSVGVAVGYHKASFSYAWGEHYDRNFGGPRHGIFGMHGSPLFMNAHGIFGTIIKIDNNTLVIKDKDSTEKIVRVNDNTTIKKLRQTISLKDLVIDQRVIVIGEPNDQGQIEAKFIRVLN